MHQGGRLHDGFGALPPHKTDGQAVKLVINTRCQGIQRGRVAARPGEQKLRRFRGLRIRAQDDSKHNMKK
jgi:hypothetical protein